MLAAALSCHAAWSLPRARRWQDRAVALLLGEHAWTLQFAACKLGLGGFECAQALLPLALQAASDQPVVWIDGTVAALGAARVVACPLDAETPLLERGLTICFEPLGGGESGSELCRLEGGDEGPRNGLVDLDAANVEAIDAAALDQDLAGAMIPRCGAAPAIVRVQAASAVPAAGKALQQGAAVVARALCVHPLHPASSPGVICHRRRRRHRRDL